MPRPSEGPTVIDNDSKGQPLCVGDRVQVIDRTPADRVALGAEAGPIFGYVKGWMTGRYTHIRVALDCGRIDYFKPGSLERADERY